MTLNEYVNVKFIIHNLARTEGKPASEIRCEIQKSIDEAWTNKTAETAAAWLKYFPDGRKPSVEKFIVTVGSKLQSNNDK